MDKTYPSVEEALADIEDGAVIAIPGFFDAGTPRVLLRALIAKGVKDLTLACGCGPLVGAIEEREMLVKNKQIKKLIDSYPFFRSASKGMEDPFEQAVRAGEIELEVFPMGTLAEKYRVAGAGIPAFYTPTGAGSVVAEKIVSNVSPNQKRKETRIFDGKEYVMEYALKTDFAFIHAYQGDREGNLVYRKTARNFNPVMATAAKITIAEVENFVEPGEIDPDCVHTPGIYVQRVVVVPRITYAIGID
jgi:3-oxoacid CoA-transferase, A subunit